jgi:hypothetical protein
MVMVRAFMDEFAEGSMAKSTSKTRGNESEG